MKGSMVTLRLVASAAVLACLATAQAAIVLSPDTSYGHGDPSELVAIYNASQTLSGRKNMLMSALGVSNIDGYSFVYEDAVMRFVGSQFCEQIRNGMTTIPVATFNGDDSNVQSLAITKYEVLALDAGCGYGNITGPNGVSPSNTTAVAMLSYYDSQSKQYYAGICPSNVPACLVFRIEKHNTAGRRLFAGGTDQQHPVLTARRQLLEDKCADCQAALDNCLSYSGGFAGAPGGMGALGCTAGYYECRGLNNCDGSCFPGHATVQVQGKGAVRMEELQYGDKVLAVDHSSRVPTYKDVYLFGHRAPAQVASFVQLTLAPLASGPAVQLQLSPMHFLPVCTSQCSPQDLAAGTSVMENRYSRDVRVGDIVMVSAADRGVDFAAVSAVGMSLETGLFNPYIRGADLVVDSVVASAHSEWLLDSIAPASMSKHLPAIYEALLTPVYCVYCMVGPKVAEWLAHGLGLADSGGKDSYGVGYMAFMSGTMLPVLVAVALTRHVVVAKKVC